MHDITYRYGFTEEAFNFQLDNNGKGGLGDDRVSISIQDGSGVNNANFATPEEYVTFILETVAMANVSIAVGQASVECSCGRPRNPTETAQ